MLDTLRIGLVNCSQPNTGKAGIKRSVSTAFGLSTLELKASGGSGKGYVPRVRLLKHPILHEGEYKTSHYICVECSAPKLLFGHSLNEVREKDLGLFIEVLRTALSLEFGIKVSEEDVLGAFIKRIDFSKNILVPQIQDAFFQAASLCRLHGEKRFTMNFSEKNYPNKGRQVIWQQKNTSFGFYEKEVEMMAEKDKEVLAALARFRLEHQQSSLLRCELRLEGRKLKNVLRPLLDDAPTLEKVWKEELSSKLLLEKFDQIIGLPRQLKKCMSGNIVAMNNELKEPLPYQVHLLVKSADQIGPKAALEHFRKTNVSKNTFYKYRKIFLDIYKDPTEVPIWEMMRQQLINMKMIQDL